LRLHEKMKADERFIVLMPPQLDILVWGARGDSITGISRRSQDIFNLAAEKNLHLALFAYPTGLLDGDWKDIEKDADTVTLVRMCLMKPEHDDYLDVLWDIIIQCIDETG
ncbi:MAG TPA: aspartate aminotransferase family protein, partial [Spirochaetota bacterium]|nr:aspartate aminotransferase family protein [Spirochaetota bacterium]